MQGNRLTALGLLLGGACAGALIYSAGESLVPRAHGQDSKPAVDSTTLAAEIEAIKSKLTDQSHVMQDVSYHFSNLWFAGQHANWDLANFYWSETCSHLRWAVRVIPIRKDKAGRDVDLAPILEALENGPLKQLGAAINEKDKAGFEQAYRATMEGCYSCHKTSDKPFLRPQIPERPETPIINFNPQADWPR